MNEAKLYHSRLDGALFYRAKLYGAVLWCHSCMGTDFGEADMRRVCFNRSFSAAYFNKTNLLGAVEFSPRKTDIFIETIMPDGVIRDDRPLSENPNI